MASTVEAKNAAGTALGEIRHWIGGKSWDGPVERWGAVMNPATGAQQAQVAFATSEVVDAAVAAAAKAAESWREASLATRTRVLFAFRQLVEKHKKEMAEILTPRARQGRCRRARRGHPRARGGRVRLRHPAAAEGRVLRERLDRRRQLLDPPAARRRRRHHALQLPGDGADVDVPDRDRLREHVHPQALREGPVGRELLARSCWPTPACPTASSTSSTATRPRSTRSWTTPGSPR